MSRPFTLRRAAELPLGTLAAHHDAGFEGYVVPVRLDTQSLAERIRVDHVDLWRSFELWQDDSPMVVTLIARRGSRARVTSMGVPVHARRQGWGRRALEVAIDAARETGESLQLEVIASNTPAVRLYEAMGFERTRTLIGFDVEAAAIRDAAPVPVAEIPTAEVAALVAIHAGDLPWQLEAASLYALGGDWRAWRLGPTVAMGKLVGGRLMLTTLLTEPAEHGRGHARRMLSGLAGVPGVESLHMISIAPEEVAGGFLDACGIPRAEVVQYEMRLRPPAAV